MYSCDNYYLRVFAPVHLVNSSLITPGGRLRRLKSIPAMPRGRRGSGLRGTPLPMLPCDSLSIMRYRDGSAA